MLIFFRRRFKSESRLPFDLRPSPYKYPGLALLGYTFIQSSVVQSELINLIFADLRLMFERFSGSFIKKKKKNMECLIPGHIVCIFIVSKTFFLQSYSKKLIKRNKNIHTFRAREVSSGFEWVGKTRCVYGLCVWRRAKESSGVILIQSKFLGVHFLYKVNLYAPNVISFLNIERGDNVQTNLFYNKTKYPSFMFKIKSYARKFKRSIKKKG